MLSHTQPLPKQGGWPSMEREGYREAEAWPIFWEVTREKTVVQLPEGQQTPDH